MRFHILPGLPPYGPLPEQFSATGHGTFSEGFVVQFEAPSAGSWVGNFHRGLSRFDGVFEMPGSPYALVIAGGAAYVVDPASRECIRTFGGQIEQVLQSPDALIFSNGLWLEALGTKGVVWRTRRLSWDGMRDVQLAGATVTGAALDLDDKWVPFSVDLMTGEAVGGSYPPDLPP